MIEPAARGPLRRIAVGAIAIILAAGVMSLALSSVLAASHTVAVVNFEYQPATITIVAGDDVRWENLSGSYHTVTADDGSFDSRPFARDEPYSAVFEMAGTFAYHCDIHPETMKGTIVVEAAPPTPVPSGPPSATPPAGTLPPNFSPFPSSEPETTSPPPTNGPTAAPTTTATASAAANPNVTSASGSGSLGLLVIGAVAGLGAVAVFWAPRRLRR